MENFKTTKNASIRKCLICLDKPPKNGYWVFIWKNRSGYACEQCADEWYHNGNYLITKAVDAMEANGIKHITWKDKYGRWEISAYGIQTQRQVAFMQNLLVLYRKLFPEFCWDW